MHSRKPPDGIILDMDSSESATHGEQEGSAWTGYFGCTCYHPLFVFDEFGDLECCRLRPGSVHSAEDWRLVLEPVIARYSERGVDLHFRADAAFARPEIYELLEAEGIRYAIQLPANQVLRIRGAACDRPKAAEKLPNRGAEASGRGSAPPTMRPCARPTTTWWRKSVPAAKTIIAAAVAASTGWRHRGQGYRAAAAPIAPHRPVTDHDAVSELGLTGDREGQPTGPLASHSARCSSVMPAWSSGTIVSGCIPSRSSTMQLSHSVCRLSHELPHVRM